MNYCTIQCNGITSREEMRSFVSIGERSSRDSLVCPKPRRVGLLNLDSSRPLRWHLGYQTEISDSRAGSDLLDIILTKGGHGAEKQSSQVASPPSFFCGSPPSRVANPIVQDARFREEQQLTPSGFTPSTNSSSRKVGCVRTNFGNKPSVRVEGFDCLDRDSRNCSIPALA